MIDSHYHAFQTGKTRTSLEKLQFSLKNRHLTVTSNLGTRGVWFLKGYLVNTNNEYNIRIPTSHPLTVLPATGHYRNRISYRSIELDKSKLQIICKDEEAQAAVDTDVSTILLADFKAQILPAATKKHQEATDAFRDVPHTPTNLVCLHQRLPYHNQAKYHPHLELQREITFWQGVIDNCRN
jgi:hypothetical protein